MFLAVALLAGAVSSAQKGRTGIRHFAKWLAGMNSQATLKSEKVERLMKELQGRNGNDAQVGMDEVFAGLMSMGLSDDDFETDINGDNQFMAFLRWFATGKKTKSAEKKTPQPEAVPAVVPTTQDEVPAQPAAVEEAPMRRVRAKRQRAHKGKAHRSHHKHSSQ